MEYGRLAHDLGARLERPSPFLRLLPRRSRMQAERGRKTRVWVLATVVACLVAFIALAQATWAQEPEGPDHCSWTKQVWINDDDPVLITAPTYFGVTVSDTVHICDTLFCDFPYDWRLEEKWDPDLLKFTDPDLVYDAGAPQLLAPGWLAWWGSASGGQWVHLDKYLHVEDVGWVTTEISETVEFTRTGSGCYGSYEKPIYLQELVEGGDAPSSYNHTSSPMTTTTFITGTQANFPVVWDWDGTLEPESYGLCHYSSLVPSFLGITVTHELDADLTPDDDGVTNIDPPNDTPDRDGADDGVSFPSVLPHCGTATVNVVGENNHWTNLYLNAWADWNRDGDWDDTSVCECGISEWIIQSYAVSPGTFDLNIDISSCHPVPDPTEPLWVRVTLSEASLSGEPWSYGGQPYPASTACFWLGETEDYYVEPELIPECEWEKQVYVNDELAGEWDEGPFAVAVSDTITIADMLSCNFQYDWELLEEWETPYLSLESWDSSHCEVITDTGHFEWSGGPVPPGTQVELTKTLHVDEPGFVSMPITETVAFSPEWMVEPMQKVVELVELLEGGDAPSSHNHAGPAAMETYPGSGVSAQFPVVWDWDGTLVPGPVSGYYGFCHYSGSTTYLGSPPTYELDADLLPDQDVVTNIDPASNTPDQDLSDDGVTIPGGLPLCAPTALTFTGHNGSGGTLYLNLWADWNRDGDWEDGSQCGCGDDEWAIQDHVVSPCPIEESVEITPCHMTDITEPLWIRVTLSEVPLEPLGEPWIYGGQPYAAPGGCFELGETQDFLFQQTVAYLPVSTKSY
jgi:hypothetical protein